MLWVLFIYVKIFYAYFCFLNSIVISFAIMGLCFCSFFWVQYCLLPRFYFFIFLFLVSVVICDYGLSFFVFIFIFLRIPVSLGDFCF